MPTTNEWKHEAKSMIAADGKHHVFKKTSEGRTEIYDLSTDPDEKKSVTDSEPTAKELQKQLAAWMDGPLANAEHE